MAALPTGRLPLNGQTEGFPGSWDAGKCKKHPADPRRHEFNVIKLKFSRKSPVRCGMTKSRQQNPGVDGLSPSRSLLTPDCRPPRPPATCEVKRANLVPLCTRAVLKETSGGSLAPPHSEPTLSSVMCRQVSTWNQSLLGIAIEITSCGPPPLFLREKVDSSE